VPDTYYTNRNSQCIARNCNIVYVVCIYIQSTQPSHSVRPGLQREKYNFFHRSQLKIYGHYCMWQLLVVTSCRLAWLIRTSSTWN